MTTPGLGKRAERALDRQLEYQRSKSKQSMGREEEMAAWMAAWSNEVRQKLENLGQIAGNASVLEVGSGAHGLIFFFDAAERIGVDPLADHYRDLFPAWQHRATTMAAFGEQLPFDDARFDIVLCDNVVDHAANPRRIIEEIARVLRPGGMLYFSVNVHHPIYHWAATAHAAWRAVGIPFEITPFADHTVHLTPSAARKLFAGLPFKRLAEGDDVGEVKRRGPGHVRHLGDRLKHLFYKNARYELIGERLPT
ncbi:class I SAM-dependent methyltransferase [Sphingomonas sp. RB56-2]|uniref:Class I SAM-dependent methyltransferase n=1 Tax=Sphingomonas brevis TaxID=2908206 RepID=A0ABT0S7M7_9SPHN|nr:class I SAM-dependent methyltransferase [Sphingomonas brevis]MCL6740410.1 class I SAM-dependent methyltransferase [Sphingomonas brevis]